MAMDDMTSHAFCESDKYQAIFWSTPRMSFFISYIYAKNSLAASASKQNTACFFFLHNVTAAPARCPLQKYNPRTKI